MVVDRRERTSRARVDEREPLGFLLAAAARRVAKFYAAALADGPVTPSQYFLLRQLWREDGLSLGELSLRAQLDATSATWLVDQLEKAGFVERRRTDLDRRVVRVWLTDAGRALRDDLEPAAARWEAQLAEALARHEGAPELEALRSALTTLIARLPEGADLWAEVAASWDEQLAALRDIVEEGEAAAAPEATDRGRAREDPGSR